MVDRFEEVIVCLESIFKSFGEYHSPFGVKGTFTMSRSFESDPIYFKRYLKFTLSLGNTIRVAKTDTLDNLVMTHIGNTQNLTSEQVASLLYGSVKENLVDVLVNEIKKTFSD